MAVKKRAKRVKTADDKVRVWVEITKAENDQLNADAKSTGQTKQAYMRGLVLGKGNHVAISERSEVLLTQLMKRSSKKRDEVVDEILYNGLTRIVRQLTTIG